MAELYLASSADPAQAREVVVLKRVLPQFSSSDNFVRMFAREARLASMLRHPNIVEVHDAGGLGAEDCFFTMEYVHGVDLGVLLDKLRDRSGALPLAHALTIAVSLCRGLHYAHEAHDPEGVPLGIVHRDVSPSNVLVGYDGAVKVTDFGVAKALAMTRLTEEGTRKGKLAYMSPEQATGETVDRRADVFAIATVLYELTTMERLFGGDNDLAVMYNILHRARPSPREVSPGYPAALEEIVLRAVSHDASERYPTALALQQALEGFARSVGLELSTEALGAFVRNTVPVPMHPRDDPQLWAGSVGLRSAPQHAVTVADALASTSAEATAAPPTGPPPGYAAAQTSAPAVVMPIAPGSAPRPIHHGSAPWPAASRSSDGSWLQWLSIGLALVAVVAGVWIGVLLWSSSETTDDETPAGPPPPPTAEAPVATPAQTPAVVPPTPTPAAPTELTSPEPAAPAPAPEGPAPAPRSTKKKKKKKRTSAPTASPEPPPEPPPSKKPSPTDTLLPIRE